MVFWVDSVLLLDEHLNHKVSNLQNGSLKFNSQDYQCIVASSQDLQQLKINAKDDQLKCKEPLMVFVGGSTNKEINVYIFIEGEVRLRHEHFT